MILLEKLLKIDLSMPIPEYIILNYIKLTFSNSE